VHLLGRWDDQPNAAERQEQVEQAKLALLAHVGVSLAPPLIPCSVLLDELESPESNEAFLLDMISPPSMHDVIESRSGICPKTRALLGAGLMHLQDITRRWATTGESLRGKSRRSKVGVDVK
jgi:hypothetical protein